MTEINLPQDLKLEVLCLGAILNSIDAANEAFTTLDDSDFFNADHKKIFTLMKSTFSEEIGCNVSTMTEKIAKPEGNFSRDYLIYLDSRVWSGMPYEEYFKDLRNLSGLRKTCYSAQELLIKASTPGAIYDDVIAKHQTSLMSTMGINYSTITPLDLYQNYKNDLSYPDYLIWKRERFLKGMKTYEGVSSEYPILDKTLGSFQNNKLYYIGARTSMGKTTFILNLISNIMTNNRVGIFSLEMDAHTIIEKLLCVYCGMKYSDISMGKVTLEEVERIRETENFLKKNHVFLEDQRGITISQLSARAKRMKKTHGIEILFIDYLTFIKSDTKYAIKHLQVDEVSKGLQTLAKDLNIPIVCLAQLNRTAVGSENDRPNMAQFRESGSIEEDADACLLPHRPDYYNKTAKPGYVELIIAKNRIMGTLLTIDYSCEFLKSDRYYEKNPVQEEIEKINEKNYESENEIFRR